MSHQHHQQVNHNHNHSHNHHHQNNHAHNHTHQHLSQQHHSNHHTHNHQHNHSSNHNNLHHQHQHHHHHHNHNNHSQQQHTQQHIQIQPPLGNQPPSQSQQQQQTHLQQLPQTQQQQQQVLANSPNPSINQARSQQQQQQSHHHHQQSQPQSVSSSPHQGALVTRQIYDTFLRARQSNETYIQKAKLREKLYNILRKCFKTSIDLYIVGSSINNLGNNNSDVDMCLVITDREIEQSTEGLTILQFVRDQLRQYDFVRRCHLILAKVPLLRFEDGASAVAVDLNVNNSVGIRNTHLINCYTRLDRRVQPLVIVIKLWARRNKINDAYNKTLSSYSLVLMVIHYLQCACEPPVLPCLQKMMPDVFKPNSDIKSLDLLEPLPDFLSRNAQSLGELLLGFLYYFSYIFKFAVDVMSIRLGGTIDKETARNFVNSKNTPTQWRWICIEEPFDRTNTARSVWDEQAFTEILNVFRGSHYRLERSKNLNAIM